MPCPVVVALVVVAVEPPPPVVPLGQARGAHTRLCQLPGLSAETLRVVEFTLGNPRELDEAARGAVFFDNACRVYRL